MGLLDDLKGEAEQLQANAASDRSKVAQQEAYYREHTKPALLNVYRYLQELLEQLEILDKEVKADFLIPGYKAVSAQQIARKININSLENLSHISLRITFAIDELQFSVMPLDKAGDTRKFFENHRMPFSDWPIRDNDNSISGLNFLVNNLEISGGIDLQADKASQQITMTAFNVQGFKHLKSKITVERIDQGWLDRLGHFVIGEIEDPNRTEVSDEFRSALREKMEAEKRDAEETILRWEEEERRQAEQNSKAARLEKAMNSVLGRIRLSLVKRPDKH